MANDTEEDLGFWESLKDAVTRPDDYEFNPPLTRDMGFLSRNKDRTPPSVKAASFVAEALPLVGDTIAAKEVWDEVNKAEPNWALVGALGGATIVGLFPGVGDAAAKAIKEGAEKGLDVVRRLEVDPNAMGSMGGNIRLRPEAPRFNEEALAAARKQNDASREILVDMPIDDFLSAAKTGVDDSKLAGTRSLVAEGTPFESVPSLSFRNNGDGTGQVTGHEGRHRALALKEQGDTTIPVLLISQGGSGPSVRWGKQLDPNNFDYVDNIPTRLIEEEGSSVVPMPESILNIRSNSPGKAGYDQGGVVRQMANENVTDDKGRPIESPRPVARPDRSTPRLIDSTVQGEDGDNIDIADYYNPISALGMSTGDSFRYLPAELTARGAYTPPAEVDGVEYMGGMSPSRVNKFYSREKPDAKPVQVDDVTLISEAGLNPQTAAHEFMHKGFEQLRNAYDLETLTDIIGEKSAKILLNPDREHLLVQAILEKETGNSYNDYFKRDGLTEDSIVLVRETADKLYGLTNDILEKQGFYVEKPHGKPGSIPEPETDGFWGTLKKAVGFAEGGLALDDQMETVFKSSRGEVDPVSGNEVPLGALPEEVRDDIPANLSEGEYIVPADVLRYYGVKFFEDLRSQAKQGWQELNEGGRVGGEPSGMEMGEDELPFDISELQTIEDTQMGEQPEMNMGGYIKGYADGGVVDLDMNALREEFPEAFTTKGTGSGQEYRIYTNDQGMTISVRFVDGKPMSNIPAGYTASGDTPAESAAPKRERKDRDTSTQPSVERKDWSTADASEFGTYIDQKDSLLSKGVMAIAGGINPLMGSLISYAGNAEDKRVMQALDTRLASITDPKDPEYKSLMDAKNRLTAANEKDSLKDKVVRGTGIYGGGKSMTDGLVDTSGDNKVNFGDTYLGDLLGFDGSIGVDAKDEEGNTIGLAASIGGGRRDLSSNNSSEPVSTTPTSSTSSSTPSTSGSNDTTTSASSPTVTTTSIPEKESYEDKINRGGGFMNGGYVSKKSKKK